MSKCSNLLGIQITASLKQIGTESIHQQVAPNQIKSQYLTHPLEREKAINKRFENYRPIGRAKQYGSNNDR